jgi:hypothetical protein
MESLSLHFDDLGPEVRPFRFTVIHCESDWSTTPDLPVSDYIAGFQDEKIDRFEYSYNTTTPYIHFTATLPTPDMQLKLSGNYLLVVYDEDPEKVVFTRRFMVMESSPVSVGGKVIQSTRMEDRQTRQQIDFVLDLNGFTIMDIGRELKVVVQQNGRWDNALRLGKPRFARGDELDYRYDEQIAFNGGNLFRSFDTKSLLYQSERISRITYDTVYNVFLLADLPRAFKQMTTGNDLNGRFYIKNEEQAENSHIEADYAWIHFFVPWPSMMSAGKPYLMGELTSWNMDGKSQLNYNFNLKGYEAALFLKQGWYDYIYVVKENGKTTGEESYIEGSHWEAPNEYTIYVYYQQAGSGFDRLIAVGFLDAMTP